MKNKIGLKKYLICSIITIGVFTIIFCLIQLYQYTSYTKNFNLVLSNIVNEISLKYPNVDINEIINILNSVNTADLTQVSNTDILKQYGINIDTDSVIMKNEYEFNKYILINISGILLFAILLLCIFMIYDKKKNNKVKDITRYIEEINKQNYKLDILENSEDELSILKNEIYKTTVMLNEQAENSLTDKIKLKDSLSDISHQLKTPLTSITIMLDNIIDNPDMDKDTRILFIKKIYREIANINFLVQSLLKLSKFDANTVNFINKDENIVDIINEAITNVSMLAELKNIEIDVLNNEEIYVNCDLKWQVEAVTNILKNCIEHSFDSGKIKINYETSKLYTVVTIKDEGSGISEKDIKHIFERFYKGENSSKDSIGIGLALSKSIIEKNNGTIKVDSKIDKGTIFTIKYWK